MPVMENTSYQLVDLDCVDWDDQRFAIRSFVSSHLTEKSLERAGILVPPWLWKKGEGRFTIVDGFKRLRWARKTGISSITSIVFAKQTDPIRLMRLRVESKLCGPALNVAEKAQVIAALIRCVPCKRIVEEYLPDLRMPLRVDLISEWCGLAGSSQALLQSAASGAICERAALELAKWEEDGRDRGVAVLEQLRCSASIQMEILERVTEIGRREGLSRVQVLNDPLVLHCLEDNDMNHRQRTQAVRTVLTRMRFPRLMKREERFFDEVGKACFPGNMRLIPPPAFEGEQWQLLLSFSSPDELRQLIARALAFASSSLPEEITATEAEKG